MANQADKEEIQKLLSGLHGSLKRKRSKRLLALMIGTGYAALAILTMSALVFSALSLAALEETAREISYKDLPAVSALIKLRSSLLAQEGFAGKYTILRDPTFVDLFEHREKAFVANVKILQSTSSGEEIAELDKLYLDYRKTSHELFAGATKGADEHRSLAVRLLAGIDSLYAKRQEKLNSAIEHAAQLRKSTVRWTIALSGSGFLLTVCVARLFTRRVSGATSQLQKATQRALFGDYSYDPGIADYAQMRDVAENIGKLSTKIKELEQLNFDSKTLAGDSLIEGILAGELKKGRPFALSIVRIDDLKLFSTQYGYAKATAMRRLTGLVLHAAVKQVGGADSLVIDAGGDTYLTVVPADKEKEASEAAVKSFEVEVAKLLSSEQEKVVAVQRQGGHGGQTLLPVTITVTTLICDTEKYKSPVEIAKAIDKITEGI